MYDLAVMHRDSFSRIVVSMAMVSSPWCATQSASVTIWIQRATELQPACDNVVASCRGHVLAKLKSTQMQKLLSISFLDELENIS